MLISINFRGVGQSLVDRMIFLLDYVFDDKRIDDFKKACKS